MHASRTAKKQIMQPLAQLRRLAKELNAQGFHSGGVFNSLNATFVRTKLNQARVRAGKLEVRMGNGPWLATEGLSFYDRYSDPINAL